MFKYLVVGIGGFVGANARLWLSTRVAAEFHTPFPLGTMIINVSGCFLIGLLLVFITTHGRISDYYRLLLVTGFLGAYTTFSTFSYDSLTLFREGAYVMMLANLFGSLVLGMAAVSAGYLCGRAL